MTSIGTGYDLSAQTYSPDGRVFQVEYAGKAVENSGTAVGLRVKDGVVLGAEKIILSKMLVEGSNKRIAHIDRHVGFASSGVLADARQLVNRARAEAAQYKQFYGDPIPARILNERLSHYIQSYTCYGAMRPFGTAVLLAAVDQSGPQLFMIEPSGLSYGYYGCAVGKGRQAAKTEIEKLKLKEMTCREAVQHVAKIIHAVHDDIKDKDFELELSWICPESGGQHQMVPKELRDQVDKAARDALKAEMED